MSCQDPHQGANPTVDQQDRQMDKPAAGQGDQRQDIPAVGQGDRREEKPAAGRGDRREDKPFVFRMKMLLRVLRHAGFLQFTLVFLVLFIGASLVVWQADPQQLTFRDGLWFSFEVVSTIGFGDVEAGTFAARIATVILSVYSIFYLALLTGVVVSYVTEMIKAEQQDSMALVVHRLEHLDTLSPEELRAVSQQVKAFRARRK